MSIKPVEYNVSSSLTPVEPASNLLDSWLSSYDFKSCFYVGHELGLRMVQTTSCATNTNKIGKIKTVSKKYLTDTPRLAFLL